MEGKREKESCRLWGASLNETRWGLCLGVFVCVCVGAGSYVCMEGGWLNLYAVFSIVELDTFGISEFGPQTRNFHPGGSDEGGSGGGGWPCRGAVWGSEWAVPLSSLPSFSPLHTFTVQLSVSTLTLSG